MRPSARASAVFGFGAGVLLLASSAAHSIGGWGFMAQQLQQLGASSELRLGLQFGWTLGSVAMLMLGLLACGFAWRRWRGRPVPALGFWVPALCYGGYGIGVYVLSGYQPGYFVFIAPALLLALAAPEPVKTAGDQA